MSSIRCEYDRFSPSLLTVSGTSVATMTYDKDGEYVRYTHAKGQSQSYEKYYDKYQEAAKKISELEAKIKELESGLKMFAATNAWVNFGDCRAWGGDWREPHELEALAKKLLTEPQSPKGGE